MCLALGHLDSCTLWATQTMSKALSGNNQKVWFGFTFSLSHHAFYACPSTFLISPFCWCWCWDGLLKRIFHHIPGFGRPRFGLVGECVTALDPGHALLSIVVIMWSQSFFFLPLLLLYSIDWFVLTSGGIWRLLAGVQLPLYLSVWALAPSTSWPLSLGVLHWIDCEFEHWAFFDPIPLVSIHCWPKDLADRAIYSFCCSIRFRVEWCRH